jgi:hypothetical protein
MWYISIFFYLYGVASIVSPNMTDISGQWVPATNFQANCTTGQKCGNSTTTMRTTFQLLANATWVEEVLVGTGNCTNDASIVDSLILVVESFGFFKG